MQYLIFLLFAVSASANYNYGHLYLLPTYEDYYGGYYGHRYGGYSRDRDANAPAVSTLAARIVYGDEVSLSPNVIPNLNYGPPDLTPAPSVFETIRLARDVGRRFPTRAPAVSSAAAAVGSFGAAPAVTYSVDPAVAPVYATAPAFRYIPGNPYGNPVIYGYSSGAYTYYSPSVLSPYSYGSYGSYGSYHSDPYGYLYKK